ncbi:superoxide dismutase [Polymorphospora rubra]|uniref:Superoxide dismutase n=1 Tax=Polymorphospora rubra TaxID=338584 RepID=A0A810MRR8_9ACTN|nr:superoxide dismutase [Polymorphospora rubra]BCJ63956.1 superoxide dismutase [Fe-Zn] 1 [Polymorphospora rubra]
MSTYTLPDLPYDYAALEPHINGQILELHHDKHHATYVKAANDTVDRIAEARDKGDFSSIVGLEKTLAFNVSGHVLHTLYWQNMSPDGGDRPDGELADAITEHFGSFEAFHGQLSAATTAVQGSGWGVLSYEPLGKRLIVEQVYDHHGNVGIGSVPLLAFDAWEHAYYLQYRNVRPDFVKAMWEVVNWPDVTARYAAAVAATRPAG